MIQLLCTPNSITATANILLKLTFQFFSLCFTASLLYFDSDVADITHLPVSIPQLALHLLLDPVVLLEAG